MDRRTFLRTGFMATAGAVLAPSLSLAQARYDLRPEAARIVARTRTMMEAADPETPAALLIGETHPKPAHVLLGILVLDMLRAENIPFTVAVELPHDTVFKQFAAYTGRPDDRSLVGSVARRDPDGQLALRTAIGWQESQAQLSHETLWHYLLERRIPTFFNDCSWKDGWMDLRDPETARHKDPGIRPHALTMDLTSVEAVRIRNIMMADRILAREGLIVQLCGSAHIYGMRTPEYHPYEYSLAARLKAADCPMLAAPINTATYGGILPADDPALIPGITVSHSGGSNGESPVLINLMKASGMDIRLPAASQKEECRAFMTRQFAQWHQERTFNAPAP